MNTNDLHKLNDNAWTHIQDDAMHNVIAAVIDLHQEMSFPPAHDQEPEVIICAADGQIWPCPTVRAITDHLGNEK